jgi:uncharacterized membrane protein YhiD involved in acid resistance
MDWLRAGALTLLTAALLAGYGDRGASAFAAQPPAALPSNPTTTELQGASDQTPPQNGRRRADIEGETPSGEIQLHQLRHAAERLPVAAILASLLALRPRRKGTPRRQTPVIETQIILAIVGAVVMIVVGSSLARAFGIVGAAGLVRYRAKIDDPKDAAVMLSTLAIGLAAGVGLWAVAVFGTMFVLVVLWIVESFEPRATTLFTLCVKVADPARVKPELERLLMRRRLDFQLHAASKEEICYDVHYPMDAKTDRLSSQILELDADAAVKWEEKKEKK